MSIVFRADDAPAASRTEYWHHVVAETIGPLDVWMPGGFDSDDRLRVGQIGPVRLGELTTSKLGSAERTPALIRSWDPELYKIDVHVRGRGAIAQDGRLAYQRPGDIAFVDLSRPCRWVNSRAQVLAVVFPRALLPLRREELARLTGMRIPAGGWGRWSPRWRVACPSTSTTAVRRSGRAWGRRSST